MPPCCALGGSATYPGYSQQHPPSYYDSFSATILWPSGRGPSVHKRPWAYADCRRDAEGVPPIPPIIRLPDDPCDTPHIQAPGIPPSQNALAPHIYTPTPNQTLPPSRLHHMLPRTAEYPTKHTPASGALARSPHATSGGAPSLHHTQEVCPRMALHKHYTLPNLCPRTHEITIGMPLDEAWQSMPHRTRPPLAALHILTGRL